MFHISIISHNVQHYNMYNTAKTVLHFNRLMHPCDHDISIIWITYGHCVRGSILLSHTSAVSTLIQCSFPIIKIWIFGVMYIFWLFMSLKKLPKKFSMILFFVGLIEILIFTTEILQWNWSLPTGSWNKEYRCSDPWSRCHG